MDDELLQTILKVQKIEYAEFNDTLRLTNYSPGISSFLSPDRIIEEGAFIADIFYELLGYDNYLADIRDGRQSPLMLDWIEQKPLFQPESDEKISILAPVNFFHLHIYPFKSGLW